MTNFYFFSYEILEIFSKRSEKSESVNVKQNKNNTTKKENELLTILV